MLTFQAFHLSPYDKSNRTRTNYLYAQARSIPTIKLKLREVIPISYSRPRIASEEILELCNRVGIVSDYEVDF